MYERQIEFVIINKYYVVLTSFHITVKVKSFSKANGSIKYIFLNNLPKIYVEVVVGIL